MKNPLDYLWYKLYKLSFYTHGKVTLTTSMGTVLFVNLFVIYFFIFGYMSYVSGILLFIVSCFLTSPYEKHKKKVKIIRNLYNESEKSRIRGNIIVTVYVILSFIILFLVAKYHITIQNIL
jgi:hypothetical protein